MLYATSHFHYCVIDGRIVGLDLRSARYFFVRGSSAAALLQLETPNRTGDPVPPKEAFKDLLRLGYVSYDASEGRPLRGCDPGFAITPMEQVRRRPSGFDTLLLSWRLAGVRLRIGTGSLNKVLQPIRKRAPHMQVRDADTLKERLGRFAASRPSIPLPRSCLLDSAALYLCLDDPSVDLVFAVSVTPFAAHCWLERDGYLLNDELDYIRRFTPIMRFRP